MKKDFKKTAIHELIDELKKISTAVSKENNMDMVAAFNYAIDVARLSIEKEKGQIIKAHIDGFDYIVAEFKKQEFAEQYFNNTYNQNDNETNF